VFICVCIALCTIVAHNIAQNRPDSFPPYPPDNLESTTETANRSVQPCLHRWPRSVPILYNRLPVSHSKLPLPMLASKPHVIRGLVGPPESGTQMTTWSFQPFCRAH